MEVEKYNKEVCICLNFSIFAYKIKTIKPISDKYELSFKIIDSNLYYLDASTSRDDNNCLIMKSAKMKYFNLLDYEIEDYKDYEFSEEVNLTC